MIVLQLIWSVPLMIAQVQGGCGTTAAAAEAVATAHLTTRHSYCPTAGAAVPAAAAAAAVGKEHIYVYYETSMHSDLQMPPV